MATTGTQDDTKQEAQEEEAQEQTQPAYSDEEKRAVVEKYQLHESDTGSPEVQIALLTDEIEDLLAHLKEHPQDMHSKHGLLKKVSKRRKLLRHLKIESEERHAELTKKLGLKQN